MTATREIAYADQRLTSRELWRLAATSFVYDPTDAADTGQLARTLGRLRGVVCVSIAPREPRPLGALSLAILERLGKDLDHDKQQLSQRDAWRLARVWMDAEKIQALIVIGADQLDAATWTGLANVARQMPSPSVILIQHQTGRDRTQRDLLDSERAFTSVPPAAFRKWGDRFQAACEHAAKGNADAVRQSKRFPAVPDDEIPFFRSACRSALSAADFRIVDAAYRHGFESTRRWLQDKHDLNEDEAGAFLADLLSWAPDVNAQLARLRGAQAAFLRGWWLLKVEPEALAAAYNVDPTIDLDDDIHHRLRAYVDPKTSALAALAITTKLPPGRLAVLNADQIYTDRSWYHATAYDALQLGDHMLRIPAARLFLRAHHLDRELRNEPPDGPLFTTTTGRRLTAAGVQQQLRRVTRDIGLPLVASWTSPPSRQHSHWMHRRGLTLQPL